MNKTNKEAVEFADELLNAALPADRQLVLAPAFPLLPVLAEVLEESAISLAAQNVHWERTGSFTGEVSVAQLPEACEYVIVGHSERRRHFQETNQLCNKKIQLILEENRTAIYCVGETAAERAHGDAERVIKEQIQQGLATIQQDKLHSVIIAYEPVWAIGTGKNASQDEVSAMIKHCKELLQHGVRVLYGGSVSALNAKDLAKIQLLDGFLVGGGSLSADELLAIASISRQ